MKAQNKKASLHSAKPKESSSMEILPERVDIQATSLKQLANAQTAIKDFHRSNPDAP